MKSADRLFHYTSIESLALILKTQRMRFTRMDCLDDIQEAQRVAGFDFGKYVLVSCWTQEEQESLPQWHMYASGMNGVRISLPMHPFNALPYTVPAGFPGIAVNDSVSSPISFEEGLGPNYFATPLLFQHTFAGPVEYVPDVPSEYAKHVTDAVDKTGQQITTISGSASVARLKESAWAFQSEYRFILAVLPTIPPGFRIPNRPGLGDIPSALRAGVDHGLRHLDVRLSVHAMEQISVLCGPLCSAGSIACVDALIAKFSPSAMVEQSALTGRIRGRR